VVIAGAEGQPIGGTLLVDVANVLGARPDGWWRDRAGATTRLLARLGRLAGRELPGPDGGPVPVDEVVAVVEGRARDVPEPAGVRLVRARGSGDDALAACAADLAEHGRRLTVVTADRGLRARLPEGVRVAGPGWLRDRLDDESGGGEPHGPG
jgi:hypothetical protein